MLKKCFLFLISYLSLVNHLYSQADNIRFEHLTIKDGLSQGIINCIYQDRQGFMWFATQDGLNKYDGYEFTVYQSDPFDSTSISDNFVREIIEDRDGNLWLATLSGGLNLFLRDEEIFIHYKHDPDDKNSLPTNALTTLYEDSSGIIWIGTVDAGLIRFDRNNNSFGTYSYDENNRNSISHNKVWSIIKGSDDHLWIGTFNGLNRFNINTKKFVRYYHIPGKPQGLSHSNVFFLYKDISGRLWAGTYGGGLNRYIPETDSFIHYTNSLPKSKAPLNITFIQEDQNNTMWIGTFDEGLFELDELHRSFVQYKHKSSDPNSINHNILWSVYKDKKGDLWIGTWGNGVNRLAASSQQFVHFRQDPQNLNSLKKNSVWAICEEFVNIDPAKNDITTLWIGTNEGLNKLEFRIKETSNGIQTENISSKLYQHDPDNPRSLSHNYVVCVHQDRDGDIWVGTYEGGLNKFNKHNNTFTRYKHIPGDSTSISHNSIFSIMEDLNGDLWIGTYNGGLNRFIKQKNIFTCYRHNPDDPNSLSNNSVFSMLQDKKGDLWFGTMGGGLNKYDAKSDRFIRYSQNSQNISQSRIWTIFEDHSERLWIGTDGGGLNLIDRESGELRHYTTRDGLPNNVIYGILQDEAHNLWLSTNNGICKFNPDRNIIVNYDLQSGLQSNEFNCGAYLKNRKGYMYFGGVNGFNLVNPSSITGNSYIPPVALTSFYIFNRKEKLFNHWSAQEGLLISYSENFFSFKFSALDYTNPQKNQYKYKMDGFQKDWVQTDAGNRIATFTNLNPGRYTFHVKGSNSAGIWNEKGASVNIYIAPPWWKTTWFKIIFSLTLVSILGLAYFQRIKYLKRGREIQERFSKKLIDSREKERKRIAAELHDGLGQNLLIASNEIAQYQMQPEKETEMLKHASESIHQSINEVREIAYNLHPHQLERLGLSKAIKSVVNKVSRSSALKISLEMDAIDDFFPKENEIHFYRIVQEALNNIMKHSMADDVKIKIQKTNTLNMTIIDNGKGFDQVETPGLGLAEMKERTRMINGTLEIISQKNKGTEIKLTIY